MFSFEGSLLLEKFGTIEEVAGGGGGAMCATIIESHREVCFPRGAWGFLLNAGRPMVLSPQGLLCPPAANLIQAPMFDDSGKPRWTLESEGTPACALQSGRLLVRSDVVVTSPLPGGLRVQDLDRRPETIFRIRDASTGEPAGWFSAPVKRAMLVDGKGQDIYVVDAATGGVFRYQLPVLDPDRAKTRSRPSAGAEPRTSPRD
jgi:hypothetical protein